MSVGTSGAAQQLHPLPSLCRRLSDRADEWYALRRLLCWVPAAHAFDKQHTRGEHGGPGLCSHDTCIEAGAGASGGACGTLPDGCGGTILCGCTFGGQTCGGGGVPGVCGTPPILAVSTLALSPSAVTVRHARGDDDGGPDGEPSQRFWPLIRRRCFTVVDLVLEGPPHTLWIEIKANRIALPLIQGSRATTLKHPRRKNTVRTGESRAEHGQQTLLRLLSTRPNA